MNTEQMAEAQSFRGYQEALGILFKALFVLRLLYPHRQEPIVLLMVSVIVPSSSYSDTSVRWPLALGQTSSASTSPQMLKDDFVFLLKDHTTHPGGLVAF